MKKNIKIVFIFIFVSIIQMLHHNLMAQETSWQQYLHFGYNQLIDQLEALENQNNFETKMEIIAAFFEQESMAEKKIISMMHKDCTLLHTLGKKALKNKNKQEFQAISQFKKKLKELSHFLKKHKLQFAAIRFHTDLQVRWNSFIMLINENQDIAQHMDNAGIQELGKTGLKMLKSKIEKDLSLLEYYEKKLHTDWIRLKLKNYILKIDIIRLRNAAIFHPFYTGTNHKLLTAYPR